MDNDSSAEWMSQFAWKTNSLQQCKRMCFCAGSDAWPYRQKAEVHGACLPWERFQRAFGLCLHNRLEAGQFYLQCGLVLTEIVLLFAVCTMLVFEG